MGEAKSWTVKGIGANVIFYPTTLKLRKREFNPLVVCHLKINKLFKQPPIKGNDRTLLRQY